MKPALLLLHGALGASIQMKPIAEKLSENYEVYMFDLPGHGGKTMPTEPFSIKLFSEAVKEFLVDNDLQQPRVFGYSMGGYIAMYMAKTEPGIFEKIITLGTKFYWDEPTAAKEIKMMDAATISAKIPAFATALEKMHAPNDWKELLARTATMLSEMGKDNPLKPEELSTISIRSVIMLGDRDKMVTLEETVNTYKALPSAEMAVLPGTGHPIEQVDISLLATLIS